MLILDVGCYFIILVCYLIKWVFLLIIVVIVFYDSSVLFSYRYPNNKYNNIYIFIYIKSKGLYSINKIASFQYCHTKRYIVNDIL